MVPVVPCATPDTEVAFIDPAQYVAGPHSSCSILGTVRTPLLFACRLADALQCTRSVPGPLAELGADWVLDGDGVWWLVQVKGFRVEGGVAGAAGGATAGGASGAQAPGRLPPPMARSRSAVQLPGSGGVSGGVSGVGGAPVVTGPGSPGSPASPGACSDPGGAPPAPPAPTLHKPPGASAGASAKQQAAAARLAQRAGRAQGPGPEAGHEGGGGPRGPGLQSAAPAVAAAEDRDAVRAREKAQVCACVCVRVCVRVCLCVCVCMCLRVWWWSAAALCAASHPCTCGREVAPAVRCGINTRSRALTRSRAVHACARSRGGACVPCPMTADT